jgi:hypothetical protein
MKILNLFLWVIFGGINTYGQYCTLGGPTSNVDSNVESVIFTGVSGGINHVGCPSQIGVEVYLNESTTLSAGSSYSLQVDFGTCGGNFAGVGAVWIDFDQSETFTQNEIVGTWIGTPPALPVLFNVSVPNNAHNGATRMRVTQQEAATLPLNPCATFQWGSVMDFGITIINGLDCGAYAGDDLANAIEVSSLPYLDTVDLAYCYGNQNLVYDSPDVFYKLTLNPTMQQVIVNTCGSNFDTYLTVLNPQGAVITYNDDHGICSPSSMISFDVNDLGYVYIVVEGWGNESGIAHLEITSSYAGMSTLEQSKITLHPNPVREVLTISEGVDDVQIINLLGQPMITSSGKTTQLNVTELEPGIYTLHFQINGIAHSERFIKL